MLNSSVKLTVSESSNGIKGPMIRIIVRPRTEKKTYIIVRCLPLPEHERKMPALEPVVSRGCLKEAHLSREGGC